MYVCIYMNQPETQTQNSGQVGGGDGGKYDPDEAEETIEVAMKRVRGASLMVSLLSALESS